MTSTPEATAAAFSNKEWIQGTHQALSGKGVVVTSRQLVGETTMVLGPAASKTSLIVVGIAHPAQALCPGASKDFSILLAS
jgi:spermidine synthase